MSGAVGSDGGVAAIHVDFEDNGLLPLLFGDHDRYLAQIENRLDISLVSRGNRLAITGAQDSIGVARSALDLLYNRLAAGQDIDAGEVDAALGVAAQGGAAGDDSPLIRTGKKLVMSRTANQRRYVEAIESHDMVFGLGPAGTGKTYLAVCAAVSMLAAARVERIVLSRPAVEAGERLGFLPGDMQEKIDPYLRPLYDALYDAMPRDQVQRSIDSGRIEIAPLAFMRGRTLADSFVILDEAQNTTPMQMKMILTRLGPHSRMVITGDPSQIDLPPRTRSGLLDAVDVLKGVDDVEFVRFTQTDVVRHDLVARIVGAYDARSLDSEGGETRR